MDDDASRHFRDRVGGIDSALAGILGQRDSARPALEHLKKTIIGKLLTKEALETRSVWQDTGRFYMAEGRYHEAIAIFRGLYEQLCEAQLKQPKRKWIPKGMPLVWLSQCHASLGHSELSARYLILTAVADAIRDSGQLDPNAGVYFRARWYQGWGDQELCTFYKECAQKYDTNDSLCSFPEHILSQVSHRLILPYATSQELDIYEINKPYALQILKKMEQKREQGGSSDGKALEDLAGYLLGCIPGFEVERRVLASDVEYDGILRNRGPKFDFRSDLGSYLLLECKDWTKPVGSGAVASFINKLILQDCRGGILFSKSGITGQRKHHAAELQILKANYRAGMVVLVLSREDFRAAAKGENLLTTLRRRYEEVRFDIPIKRLP